MHCYTWKHLGRNYSLFIYNLGKEAPLEAGTGWESEQLNSDALGWQPMAHTITGGISRRFSSLQHQSSLADVQPTRKCAAIFNAGSEKWEMGRAAGQIKGRVTSHAFLYRPAKIWLEISHQTLFSSCPFWDMHSSLVHNFAVSKETACCSPHSTPQMTVWLHSVREPIKHCSQNDSAAAWLIAILVNPKGHMNLMMGCSVCFFISAVMMRPRHGVTAWRQPKEKKGCGIAGFKEPIPIITLLRFLKEDKYEKPIS